MSHKESSVRRWLKAQGGDAVFWVEPARGGTVGMCDALVASGGQLWPLELKVGGVVRGRWIVALRPAQRASMRRLCRMGVEVGVLVGDGEGGVGIVDGCRACMRCGPSEMVRWRRVRDWGELIDCLQALREKGEG
jgi:hypothetical protein